MKLSLDNFTKKLNKLDNYFVLCKENEHYILGSNITIIQNRTHSKNIFQPLVTNQEKILPVFFVLTFTNDVKEIEKYQKNKILIYKVNADFTELSLKNIKLNLDNWIQITMIES